MVLERAADGTVAKRPFTGRDVLVIDEASMLDVPGLWDLVRKTGGARLLLVGDPAQLPPIGPGKPFIDLLGKVPTVTLERIYRQGAGSGIPRVAAAIRNGGLPDLPAYAGPKPGVSFVAAAPHETPDRLVEIVQDLARSSDPGDIQILSSVRKGPGGVIGINRVFSDLHGTHRETFPGHPGVRAGDPVIFLENDVDRDLANGSMGRYLGGVATEIEGRRHDLDRPGDAGRIDPAYALTIHKAQGSQWRRVVVVVHRSGLLDRSMLYTAITRAAEQVVLVGDHHQLAAAVAAETLASRRQTALPHYLDLAGRRS